jgi:alanine racemase
MADYGFGAPDYVRSQVEAVTRCMMSLENAGVSLEKKIVANSSILLTVPEADLSCVEPGRLVMGVSFEASSERRAKWRPVLAGIKSRLIMVKQIDHKREVPEGPFFRRRPGMRIGLMPLGWADGFTGGSIEVLIKGVRESYYADSC